MITDKSRCICGHRLYDHDTTGPCRVNLGVVLDRGRELGFLDKENRGKCPCLEFELDRDAPTR